jgi:hypothetical protein
MGLVRCDEEGRERWDTMRYVRIMKNRVKRAKKVTRGNLLA